LALLMLLFIVLVLVAWLILLLIVVVKLQVLLLLVLQFQRVSVQQNLLQVLKQHNHHQVVKLLQLLQVVVELILDFILVQSMFLQVQLLLLQLLSVLQHQLPAVNKPSQVVVCAAGDKA
jgi:hypothetical protein